MSQKRDFEEGKARVEGGSSEDKRRRFKRFNFVSVSRVYHDVVGLITKHLCLRFNQLGLFISL